MQLETSAAPHLKKVGVVGCGLMGSGIAQVCAEAGHKVIVREVNDAVLAKGLGSIDKFLSKGVEKGKLTAEKKAEIMGRLQGGTKLEDLAPCDVVIEAVVENIELKHQTFQALHKVCGKGTIFASNTSSLSITEMAAGSGRADRFVGLHFFNPVPLMKLVEVVRGPLTSPDVFEAMCAFGTGIGKTVVRATDKPGFIVNRLLVPYMVDAIRALEQGVGSVHRRGHEARLRLSHGSVHAARLRGPRDHLLHRQHHVRRVQGSPLRSSHPAQAYGPGRDVREEGGQGLLRLLDHSAHADEGPGLVPMAYTTLLVEKRDDGIAVITINRPDKLNALNATVIGELDAALADLDADAAVRALIVTGAGEKAFVAGADIAELASATPIEARALALKGQRVFDRLERFRGPVIAAVNGFALGGGCELALACHIRLASEQARFGTPEVKLGLMCGYAGTQRLPRLVGRGRALEILLSGEMVPAEEALRIGLVNRVVAKDALLSESVGLLGKMLANAPLSLKYTIDSVNAGLDMSIEDAQDHEATLFAVLCSTADKTEGTRAFLEKRPAKFQGR